MFRAAVRGDQSADARLRDLALRMHDLHLLGTAANYDLGDDTERQRSADDLAALFLEAVGALQPDLFIEAGAKAALTSRRADALLDDGARIVAFEANPYTYEKFRPDNPPESRVEYRHLALSDEAGPVTFHVRTRADGKPRADGHGSLMQRREDYPYDFEQVTVEATTLDGFFADHPFEACALWIDVEGAAGPVLSGARDLLGKASVLLIEVEDRRYWKKAWTRGDVAAFLYDRGMVPVARDFEFTHQCNVLFVQEALLAHAGLRRRLAQYASACAVGRPFVEPAASPPASS